MRDDQEIDRIAGETRKHFRTAGQEHVFTFWDHLEAPARRRLLNQCEELELELLEISRSLTPAEPQPGWVNCFPLPAFDSKRNLKMEPGPRREREVKTCWPKER